jgi:hypothetical protein
MPVVELFYLCGKKLEEGDINCPYFSCMTLTPCQSGPGGLI